MARLQPQFNNRRRELLTRSQRHGSLLAHSRRLPIVLGWKHDGHRAAAETALPAVPPVHDLDEELLLARDIQQGILLADVPYISGWEMSAVSQPARAIGGDLYDFLPLAGGLQGIMVGDISGKGLPAALRMAVTRTIFRYESHDILSPAETLAAVNRRICREMPHGMVTMVYAIYDPEHGEVRIANAGHTYPIVINGACTEIELSGIPLGVLPDADYTEVTIQLAPGESIMFYTDGVTEATDQHDEMFDDRLETVLREHAHVRPRTLMTSMLHALRDWSLGVKQADDITMVIMRRRCAALDDEINVVMQDVLGPEAAADLRSVIDAADAPDGRNVAWWTAFIPGFLKEVQARFGRGFARELQQSLRLAIEEQRSHEGTSDAHA